MPSIKALIVDSDQSCISQLSLLLENELLVNAMSSGDSVLDQVASIKYDLILLDIETAGLNGFEFCRRVSSNSEQYGDVRIIIISERCSVYDRIVGLESGADDFLAKPFDDRELLARVKSVLRRRRCHAFTPISLVSNKNRGLTYCDDLDLFYMDGVPLNLTLLELELLKLLSKNSERVVKRDEIISNISSINENVYDRAVDSAVCRLRTKLREKSIGPQIISTVWGVGYRFSNTINAVEV